MNYLEYRVEEFVLDEYFQKWILDNDAMVASFWERWLEENPHKRQDVEGASRIVRAIQFKEEAHTEEEFNQVWNNIILKRTPKRPKKPEVPLWANRKIWTAITKVAAVVLVAAFVSLVLAEQFSTPHDPVKIATVKNITKKTGIGGKLTFQLPDGSIVKLNSSSRLTFPEMFDSTMMHIKPDWVLPLSEAGDGRQNLSHQRPEDRLGHHAVPVDCRDQRYRGRKPHLGLS